jgi:hypothetical protein
MELFCYDSHRQDVSALLLYVIDCHGYTARCSGDAYLPDVVKTFPLLVTQFNATQLNSRPISVFAHKNSHFVTCQVVR